MVLLIRDTVIVTLLSYPLELLRISYAACERDYDLSSVKCVCQCKLLQPEKKAMRQANIYETQLSIMYQTALELMSPHDR